MRFYCNLVVAASLYVAGDQVSAAPTGKRMIPGSLAEISTLGGRTVKISQIQNSNFHGARKGRGAIAIARAYSKYGAPVPDDLLAYIEQLAEGLGLAQNPDAGNKTSASPQGEKIVWATEVAISTYRIRRRGRCFTPNVRLGVYLSCTDRNTSSDTTS